MECSQTHDTDLSALNFLFVCLPPLLYGNYTTTAYPLNPSDPGLTPDYTGLNDAADRANAKTPFSCQKMNHIECKKIDALFCLSTPSTVESDIPTCTVSPDYVPGTPLSSPPNTMRMSDCAAVPIPRPRKLDRAVCIRRPKFELYSPTNESERDKIISSAIAVIVRR